MSAHNLRVSVSYFRLLKWETFTLISSGLRLQRPGLNPVNYKICIQINQRVSLRKIRNVNWPTLWQRIMDNSTDEWCERLWVCSCKKTTFLVFSLTADSIVVHFNVLVWWKLQVSWCYCVEYIRFSLFWFFTFHKVVRLHIQGLVEMTNILLQIPCWIRWWKNFKNRATFGKVINEKCHRSFLCSNKNLWTNNVIKNNWWRELLAIETSRLVNVKMFRVSHYFMVIDDCMCVYRSRSFKVVQGHRLLHKSKVHRLYMISY